MYVKYHLFSTVASFYLGKADNYPFFNSSELSARGC